MKVLEILFIFYSLGRKKIKFIKIENRVFLKLLDIYFKKEIFCYLLWVIYGYILEKLKF